MVYYCEKCYTLTEQDCCQICGNQDLRIPENYDYCFLIEIDSIKGSMFKGILKEENIPYSSMPSGNGLRSCFGLRLENEKIFVPYIFYDKATELLDNLTDFEAEQNNELKNNLDKLFALPRNDIKMRRNLKLTPRDSLIDYCADKIKNADKIINQGSISGCLKGGEYLFVYNGNELFTINSATYEIIDAKRR